MAKLRPVKTNFTNGEVDPLITMRSDLELFVNGVSKLRNAWSFPQGGFRRRDGLEFMVKIPPPPQVKPIGVVNVNRSPINGGINYAVGDVLTIAGGTGTSARIVVDKVFAGNSTITDFHLISSGDYTVAPTSPATVTGGSGSGAQFSFSTETQGHVQVVDFTFSTTQNYLIVFTVSRFYVFRKEDTGSGPNQLVFQGLHPYSDDQILEFTWTQSLDLMVIMHQAFPPISLSRFGENNWTVTDFEITNPPSFAFGVTQTSTLTVSIGSSPKVGDQITLTVSAISPNFSVLGNFIRIFGSADLNGEDTSSYYRVVGGVTSISVTAEILVLPLTASTSFTVNGVSWLAEEPEWGHATDVVADRGYPRCGTFFQGRFCLAGSTARPNTFWASRAGDIHSFNNGGVADDLGIAITSDTGDVATFQNIYPGRHLQLFADSSEFYIPVSELEPITPTTAALRRTTSVGSVPDIPVFEVDGVVYFLQRGGESMRQFVFEDGEKAYSANIVSLFSSHLIRKPRDAAFKKSLNTEDGNYIWIVNREDGSLSAFSLLRSELINAWSLQTTQGEFHHVAVLDQITYFHVVRNIDGEDVDYIEFFNRDLRFDAGVIATNLVSPVTVVSDLEHLEGESVQVIVDDILFAAETVVGGSITLPVEAQDSYQLGLAFPQIEGEEDGVNVLVQTLPSDILLAEGSRMGKKKRVVTCTVRFVDTQGFYLQNRQVPFRSLPDVLDVPIPLQTGDKELKGLTGWDLFGQIKITQKEPLAMTVLGMAYDLSVG